MGVLAPRSRAPDFVLPSIARRPGQPRAAARRRPGRARVRGRGVPDVRAGAAPAGAARRGAARRRRDAGGGLRGPARGRGSGRALDRASPGTVLAEPAPYDVSRRVRARGAADDGARGPGAATWSSAASAGTPTGARGAARRSPAPRRRRAASASRASRRCVKPGCAAKSTLRRRARSRSSTRAATSWRRCSRAAGPTACRSCRRRASASRRCSAAATRSASLGEVPPAMGEATLERVAACAVLAGCRPEYFPVVVAAVRGRARPGLQPQRPGGDDAAAGPARRRQRAGPRTRSASTAAWARSGPGARANLTIGRALRLVVTLTGGARPGGSTARRSAIPASSASASPRTRRAAPGSRCTSSAASPRERSVVTLIACDAPLSISDHRSTSAEELACVLGWAAATTWSPNWWPLGATLGLRRLPRAPRAVRRRGLEQAARPRGDVRGRPPPRARAARRRDHAARRRRRSRTR